MWILVPVSQVESVQHGCGRWCRYSATTSRYSLSRLRTRMSHLHFTIYYLILHLVQYFFSLKNVDRLSSRKGITTGDNAQRSRGGRQQQQGNSCQGCLPSAPAPQQDLLWQAMETAIWRLGLWKSPLGTSTFRDSLKCPQQLFFNLFIKAAFLAAFAAPALRSWLAVW